jgi:ATP-dependent helicase HrpA
MFDITYPEELPISARRQEIVEAIRCTQVVVVAGETGSGKTTQLPKMCLDAGLAELGRIGCTQPRRVAAMSVSRRVADELGVIWGREVGCKMRFNDDTSAETRIKFMTDGILLAEIQSDPNLRAYSALIIDEAHERSLNIDFLLGYLQGLLKQRPELKLIITSATIDTVAFSKAFQGAPIIEVSGRLWPVEVRYAPAETIGVDDSNEALTHIEAAVRVTEQALLESADGDLLVFMPTERDIRETVELLEDALGRGTEVLALYGRMSGVEQQRIFTPGSRRRVIVATNVAETSLTLPRIRYVIDSGMARMSRYNPRTRTKRLPVEAISQSSANQRAGRAGRLREGVAIRLYSEEDFLSRVKFTQPEIQRANLAEVILRMKAFGLGEIETFPFINAPQAAAIRSGYRLLHELGALDESNVLTSLGRELARLPLDPTLGRMLIQASKEQVLPEMLIIASGLSVQDPRERPAEEREAAQSAHKKFADSRSDFLSYLKIWQMIPLGEGRSSSGALRRFCKANYLSYVRMREWRDIHRQLEESFPAARRESDEPAAHSNGEQKIALNRRANMRGQTQVASRNVFDSTYIGIHRAILSGLIGQVAQRQEINRYKAAGNRLVALFPGSHLYVRQERRKKGIAKSESAGAGAEKKRAQPEWIVAAEIVETSQIFARSVASILPSWVVELGGHLCESRFSEPAWSARAERVLVLERVLLHGLEVARKRTDYGKIDSVHATELFIRGALVQEEARISSRFFVENQKVREKVETALTRVRHQQAQDLDEVIYRFYADRIHGVSSVHDLNRFLEENIRKNPNFCILSEDDLLRGSDASFDEVLFPDKVLLGNTALPLSYAFNPGDDEDGVTIQVPLPVASQLTEAQIQWFVPGLREEQISLLLRSLPKVLRRAFMPIDVRASEVAREFDPGRGDFLSALAEFLTRRYRVHVRRSDWPERALPPHLCPRVEVVDQTDLPLAAGRDLKAIQEKVAAHEHRSGAWHHLARQWERNGILDWSFGDLPSVIFVENVGGAPLNAYPGLDADGEAIAVRLFRQEADAVTATKNGIQKLVAITISKDLVGLRKELFNTAKKLFSPKPNLGGLRGGFQQLSVQIQNLAPFDCAAFAEIGLQRLIEHAFIWAPVYPLEQSRFRQFLEEGRQRLPSLAYQLGEVVRQILTLKEAIKDSSKPYVGMAGDLERLAPPDLLKETSFERLQQVPRYLKAIQVRAERAALKPSKDAERAMQLAFFNDWQSKVGQADRERFRWLLEEFRVSLFAQEIGTLESVSAAKLKALGAW